MRAVRAVGFLTLELLRRVSSDMLMHVHFDACTLPHVRYLLAVPLRPFLLPPVSGAQQRQDPGSK